MTEGLVRFLCTAPEHSRAGRDAGGGVLTIVSGEWAFCAFGKTNGHTWERTEGIDIPTARALGSRRDPPAEAASPA